MAYIGREPLRGEVILLDSIESQFNGSLTTFNLTRTIDGVTSSFYPVTSQQLLVSLGGVIQKPDSTGNVGYRISFNQIIFAVAPASGTSCFIVSYGNILDNGNIVDGTVTPAKLSTGGIYWDTSGNVGIGTTSPSESLHLFKQTGDNDVPSMLRIQTVRDDFTSTPGGSAILFKNQDVNNGTNEGYIQALTVNEVTFGDNDEANTSFVFKMTNGGVLQDNVIFTGDGRVGIGKLNPVGRLNLAGETSQFPVALTIDRTTHVSSIRAAINFGYDWLLGTDTIGNGTRDFFFYSNVLNYSPIRIDPTGVLVLNSSASAPAVTGTASQSLQVTGGAYISGNVGIGTTNPSTKLHISGDSGTLLRLDGGTGGTGTRDIIITEFNQPSYGGIIRYNSDEDRFTFGTLENSNVVNAINVKRFSGKVGIGDTNPIEKLSVDGDINFNNNALVANWDRIISTNIDHIWHSDAGVTGAGGAWHFVSDGAYKADGNSRLQAGGVYLSSATHQNYFAGNVGIGDTNPTEKFVVSGPVITYGATGTNKTNAGSFDYSSGGIETRILSWGDANNVGKISFWQGAGGVGTDKISYFDPSGRLIMGGNASYRPVGDPYFPSRQFFSEGAGSGHYQILVGIANRNDTQGPTIILGRSGGTTVGSNTAVVSGMQLGSLQFVGADGTDLQNKSAVITCSAEGTIADNSVPANITFATSSGGGLNERLRISSTGNIGIGTTNPNCKLHVEGFTQISRPSDFWSSSTDYYNIGGLGSLTHQGAFEIALTSNGYRNSSNTWTGFNSNSQTGAAQILLTPAGLIRFRCDDSKTNGSTYNLTERMRINPNGINYATSESHVYLCSTSQASGGAYLFFQGKHSGTVGAVDSGTASYQVFTNGSVLNSTGSYTQISDANLKENIVDAKSQWSDIKSITIRNFNFKEETGHETHTQIGLIAQELELVCPELVKDIPNIGEDGEFDGTSTKTVNNSVLYMKAVKALQEAMKRIEELETRLNNAGI